MKLKLISSLLLSLAALPVWAAEGDATLSEQEIRAIGPLPEDKVADTIKKTDRNPFAEKLVVSALKEDGESEDSKLRGLLSKIDPSGVIKDKDGRYKVLCGRRLLSEGDPFPKMLDSQVAMLRVTKITEKSVEISWVEDQVNAVPRKVIRPVRVNLPIIEQVSLVPGEDRKSSGTIHEWVTPSGQTLKEPSVTDADPVAPTSAVETMKSEIEASAGLDLNHRPAPPTVQRAFRRR